MPLALLLAACGEYNLDVSDTDPGSDETGFVDDTDRIDSDDAPPEGDAVTIDGLLVISSGEVDVGVSTLQIDVWRDSVQVCPSEGVPSGVVTLSSASVATFPADVPVFSGFLFDLAPGDDACEGIPFDQLRLGIGAMDTRLLPAMEADGEDPASADRRYGLYFASADSDAQVWVFGTAATATMLDGSEAPATAPPIADGTYALNGLFRLPMAQ